MLPHYTGNLKKAKLKNPSMRVVQIPIGKLKPAGYNPRKMSEKEAADLTESIKRFGFAEPIIVNNHVERQNIIVGGHQRVEVAKLLGMATVPVVYVTLNLAQEQELNLRLNKNLGQWDWDMLANIDKGLLTNVGFDPNDINTKLGLYDYGAPGTHNRLREKFAVPPFSTLDTRQGYWQERKALWDSLILDEGQSREREQSVGAFGKINKGISILDSVLAELTVRWFGKEGFNTFDPFAGDTVYGFVAAYLGLNFTGIELRQEQCDINSAALKRHKLEGKYICDSAINLHQHIEDKSQDLIFSCPPYADLEVYSSNPQDLSNMPHSEFFDIYRTVLVNTYRKLKDNRFAVIVIAEVRNKKTGEYISLVRRTIEFMEYAGYKYYNELILINAAGTAPLRANRHFKNRKMVKLHQNVLVFYKGNLKEIPQHFDALDLTGVAFNEQPQV